MPIPKRGAASSSDASIVNTRFLLMLVEAEMPPSPHLAIRSFGAAKDQASVFADPRVDTPCLLMINSGTSALSDKIILTVRF